MARLWWLGGNDICFCVCVCDVLRMFLIDVLFRFQEESAVSRRGA